MIDDQLIQRTLELRKKAYAPYSNFHVGALLITKNGNQYIGINVENSSYSLTICAERVAAFKAISAGETLFKELYLATDLEKFCPPCGACRQVLWELAGNIKIILINSKGEYITKMLAELFPDAFDKHFLGIK